MTSPALLLHLQKLCLDRGMNPEIFKRDERIDDAPLSAHVSWLFEHIYSIAYSKDNKSPLARVVHGIQHVSRAAYYLPVIVNFNRMYGQMTAFSNEDIRLLQLALLLHDSARRDDGTDFWDNDSALFLYAYLVLVLNYSHEKAQFAAEAVANKDATSANYMELIITDERVQWRRSGLPHPRNDAQKAIHDSDCFEVIRARAAFDAKHLDLYQDLAQDTSSPAFLFMANLICEVRSLISRQGDHPLWLRLDLKTHYENVHAFEKIDEDIQKYPYPLLQRLYAKGQLLSEEALLKIKEEALVECEALAEVSEEVSSENLTHAMHQGLVFFRGVALPSAQIIEPESRQSLAKETAIEREMRKNARVATVETRARKHSGKLGKHGNPSRSITIGVSGSSLYCFCGLGMLNLARDRFKEISAVDLDSDRGKKKQLSRRIALAPDVAEEQLKKLMVKQRMGGTARNYHGYYDTHNEILYDLHENDIDFIYFTNDPTCFGSIEASRRPVASNQSQPYHPLSAELQAIYIQQSYEKQYPGKTLPIVEYSGVHHLIQHIEYTDKEAELLKKWKRVCKDAIRELAEKNITTLIGFSPQAIKIYGIHGITVTTLAHLNRELRPADSLFSEEFQHQLNHYIQQQKQKVVGAYWEKIKERLREGKLAVNIYQINYYLKLFPHLGQEISEEIISFINSKSPEQVIESFFYNEHYRVAHADFHVFGVYYLFLAQLCEHEPALQAVDFHVERLIENLLQEIQTRQSQNEHQYLMVFPSMYDEVDGDYQASNQSIYPIRRLTKYMSLSKKSPEDLKALLLPILINQIDFITSADSIDLDQIEDILGFITIKEVMDDILPYAEERLLANLTKIKTYSYRTDVSAQSRVEELIKAYSERPYTTSDSSILYTQIGELTSADRIAQSRVLWASSQSLSDSPRARLSLFQASSSQMPQQTEEEFLSLFGLKR